jgi:hypothetical protein
MSRAVTRRMLEPGATYRPDPVAVAVDNPPLRIVQVDRCACVSVPRSPMIGTRIAHTRARTLSEVGRVDDHFGGVEELKGVVGRELQ